MAASPEESFMSFVRPEYRNAILAQMSSDELAFLKPHLERVVLKGRDTLEAPDVPIQYVYFIEEGIVSVVAKMSRGRDRDIEVALIGREGMSGCALVQGDDRSPHRTFVQFDGTALRISAADFHAALLTSPSMRDTPTIFARLPAIQVVATALAIGRFRLEQRLARWMLMAQ